jgi:hypothetical protein
MQIRFGGNASKIIVSNRVHSTATNSENLHSAQLYLTHGRHADI